MNDRCWHVYEEAGYESAHRSEAAARRAAQRYSRRLPHNTYSVVTALGYTGGGRGVVLATFQRGTETNQNNGGTR